jgi:hypothetical protein
VPSQAGAAEAGAAALEYGGGCLAFTPALRQVAWPSKFHPIVPVKFEGNTNPKEFLALYSTAMVAARANEKIMANWFPMALKGTALSWLMHLPKESISSWGELCTRFVSTFQGGFKRPGMLIHLHAIVQKEGERLRDFMLRFS